MTAVEKQEEIITDYDSSAEFRPAGKQGCNTADTNMRDEDEDEHGDKIDDKIEDCISGAGRNGRTNCWSWLQI